MTAPTSAPLPPPPAGRPPLTSATRYLAWQAARQPLTLAASILFGIIWNGTMSAVLRGRTVVAIAHRLHTSRDADRIAVLDRGTLVELGSHDELLRLGGHYTALWESWSNEE